MVIRLNLKNGRFRAAMLVTSVIMLGFLTKVVIAEFIAGTLIDETTPEILISAVDYLPYSGRLFARLATVEMKGTAGDLESAEAHVSRAIELSPNNYNYRLLLASVREAQGNQSGAQQSLNDALALAPNYSKVHWRMANLLVRMGRIQEAIEHFQILANTSPELVPAMLDLIWSLLKQEEDTVATLQKVVENNPQAQLSLARFLANQSRIGEGAKIFGGVDKEVAVSSLESSFFFDLLITKGYPKTASDLWEKMMGEANENKGFPKIWNGDFEIESSPKQPAQFNWKIKISDYVRVSIDDKRARSGKSSLLLAFAGKDTTRLSDEVQKLIVLEPGVNYRLEYYMKTEDFRTPEGPRVVVSDRLGKLIAASEPVPLGTNDWTRAAFNFTPQPQKGISDGSAPLIISIKREPHYAYDEPTSGRIWFDDFAISIIQRQPVSGK